MYINQNIDLLYLSILKPGSYTCRGSNICRVVQQNKWNKCLGPLKRRVPKLLNLMNIKMMSCIKDNKLVLNISLDMCILLLDINCYSWSFTIYWPHLLSSSMTELTRIVSDWCPYTFINMLASNHDIKLVNTGTGTCHSILDRWTLGNKCWGLSRCWTFLNAGSKIIYRK